MKKKYIIAALALASGLALSSNAVKADNTDKKSDIAAGSKTSADAEDSAVDAAGVSTLSDETSVGNASVEGADHFLNIGSVSKVYTVTAVMQLVDQGKVDLDSPLTTYIPEFRMADERYKDITVRMLMNHTAGFMGTMYGGALLCDEGSTEYHDRFLENLSIERLKYTPGEYNCYSNDGFTLQEILIEKVSGMSFTDYIEKNICEPLSLSNTGTVWNMDDMNRQVPYYINGNIQMKPEVMMILGGGGLMTDAEELVSFGGAFFTGDNTLISENSKKEMAKNYAAGSLGEGFGLGWDIVSRSEYDEKGVKVLMKGGDTNFQHTDLVVAPDEKISIAVLSSGGSSTYCEKLAYELLDIALDEKGITVEHPEEELPVTVDSVPEEFIGYAGVYANKNIMIDISFPEGRYMLLRTLTANSNIEQKYMYTEEGSFVSVSGDVLSGNAFIVKPVEKAEFVTDNGRVFLKEIGSNVIAEKMPEVKINDDVKAKWEERKGMDYYYISGSYNDMYFIAGMSCMTLNTSDEAPGYVNSCTIIDENHAENRFAAPDSSSRDIYDIEMSVVDGNEILTLVGQNASYISERNIPEFTKDITEVKTKKGAAGWYRISGMKDETVRFDIPENAAVYVYDQYGNLKYTNFMSEYDAGIPLPDYGMIVFVGDTGATIGINR